MLKFKIYLSDEGYGHIVRQKAVSQKLKELSNNQIDFTVQTERNLEVAKEIFSACTFMKKYNNINWAKNYDGSPNIDIISKNLSLYPNKFQNYLENEEGLEDYNFIISDFVYEAFALAYSANKPAFGIAHFTWGWFFSKLVNKNLYKQTFKLFEDSIEKSKKIYFPPFTPNEIIKKYKNIVNVPLIIRESKMENIEISRNCFNILIVDSGSGLLKNYINHAMSLVGGLNEIRFFVGNGYNSNSENIVALKKGELMLNYIEHMDLVIGRAGFNTISECIALRKPMLLLGESFNPEIDQNISMLKKEGLGSFISLDQFTFELDKFLPNFLKTEYSNLEINMKNHSIQTNGAEVIANDILNSI